MRNLKIYFTIIFLFTSFLPSYTQELTPEQIYEKVNDCVVVILAYDFNGKLVKQGSGVVINDKGWVVTNYHVFAECESMEIKHNEKIVKYSDILGVDVEKDILILKIDDYTFPSILMGSSDSLKVGQSVYAIGSPLGFENSMSEGIISGLRNLDIRNRNYIQITASISHGSSGSAIVNSKGELIGISTLTIKEGQNLNFAIPVNDILQVTLGSYSEKKYIEANNYYYKGYNASENGNHKEAIKYFTKFLELYPNNASAYINRGISYGKLQKYDEAIADFNKAIELKPDYADAYNNRGITYRNLLKYDKAIADYTKAIELKPDLADAYNNRGNAYSDLKRYGEAIVDYTKAIDLKPDYADAYYNRGNSYYDLKQYDKAIADYTKAIGLKPDLAYAYNNRGNAYYGLKQYDKAIKDWENAINLNPDYKNKLQEWIDEAKKKK